MQLVELQAVLGALTEHGVALFAISYDPVEALAAFAQKYGITFPLLADEGSHVIRALGLLDEHLDQHHAEFGGTVREEQRGVCYPGVFLLDAHGVVTQRRFQRNYRVRESGAGILEQVLGVATPELSSNTELAQERVQIRVHIDSPTYWRYQRLNAMVEVHIAPGWHIYGNPIPAGYSPLRIDIDGDGVAVGQAAWPDPAPLRMPGLDEAFWVFEGTLRVAVPFEVILERGELLGDRTLRVTVSYQACTSTSCDLPRQVAFELGLKERPAVD